MYPITIHLSFSVFILFAVPYSFAATRSFWYVFASERLSHVSYLSARVLDIPLPEQPPWWELFDCLKEGAHSVSLLVQYL